MSRVFGGVLLTAGMYAPEMIYAFHLLCESVAGDLLREHGYEVEGTARPERGDHTRLPSRGRPPQARSRKRDMLDLVRRRSEPSEVAYRPA